MEVALPFRADMALLSLQGVKTATTRTRRYGRPGDIFRIDGCPFIIISVELKTLGEVSRLHYAEEGFDTPDDFVRVWCELHPRAGFDERHKVYLHRYKRLESDDDAKK